MSLAGGDRDEAEEEDGSDMAYYRGVRANDQYFNQQQQEQVDIKSQTKSKASKT